MKSGASHVARVGLMGSVLLGVQVVLAGLPNIELVSLLVILFTLTMKRQALFAIYVFVALEGLLYGFGLWWAAYTYVWALLYGLTRLLHRHKGVYFWALVSALFGLLFGTLTSLPYFAVSGPAGGFAYIISGIPFDITHGIGNFLLALVLFFPLKRGLELYRVL